MKIEYEPKHDILSIEFSDARVEESEEVGGIIFDYGKGRRIVAIEILDASKRISKKPLGEFQVTVKASA